MPLRTLYSRLAQSFARMPVTVLITIAAITAASSPILSEMLQFDRERIAGGELWRVATAHISHWNLEHLQWDLLMFVVLGAICELRNPRHMRACVVLSAASVSALVYLAFPALTFYRGLSGIDTALFTWLACSLLGDARRTENKPLFGAIASLLTALALKTAFEAFTGHAIFVDQNRAGFELLVWDHIVAAVVGACVVFGAGVSKYGEWPSSEHASPGRVAP